MKQQIYNPQLAARAPGLPPVVSGGVPQVDGSGVRVMEGLSGLARQVGDQLGRMYVSEQTGRVDDMLLGVDRKFTEWRAEYERVNQGSMALNAARDYGEKYNELVEEAIAEFGGSGHEVFGDLLKRRLLERGAYAVKDGISWESRQRQAWQASQEASQVDQYFREVGADPYDSERISQEAAALKGAMQARHPGIDLGAKFAEIDEKTVCGQAESFLARGDVEAVRRLFGGVMASGGQAAEFGEGGGGGALGTLVGGRPKAGSLSERNLSVWNYGNVKTTGGGFAAYASQADGLMAMAERFLRYHNAPERGWHANTLREVMNIYAPPSENQTNKYAETLAKWMGIDPDARLDFSNPDTLAKFIRHVPRYEHGQFVKIAEEDARAAAAAVLAGQKPRVVGQAPGRGQSLGRGYAPGNISPKLAASYLSRADAIERQRQAELQAQMQDGINNYVAAAKDGHIMDVPYSSQEVLAAWGPEKGQQVWNQLQAAHELSLDMSSARTMNARELAALSQAREPDPQSPSYRQDAQYHQLLQRQIMDIQKRRQEDPALYVTQTNPQAEQAARELVTALTPESARKYISIMSSSLASQGMNPEDVLSKSQKEIFANWLGSAENPAEAAGRLAQCFGDHFPTVMRAISPVLAPDIALMASGMDGDASRLIMQARQDKDFEKKNLALFKTDIDRNEFESMAREKSDEMARSFLGGGDDAIPTAIQQQTRMLALQYMRTQGINAADAIDRAYAKVIGDRYELVSQHAPGRSSFFGLNKGDPLPPCRIPKSQNVEAISRGLGVAIESLPVSQLARETRPDVNQQELDHAYAKLLAANAYWLTDGDESGVVLFMDGNAVSRNDGQPYRLSWDELLALGEQASAREEAAANLRAASGETGIALPDEEDW